MLVLLSSQYVLSTFYPGKIIDETKFKHTKISTNTMRLCLRQFKGGGCGLYPLTPTQIHLGVGYSAQCYPAKGSITLSKHKEFNMDLS